MRRYDKTLNTGGYLDAFSSLRMFSSASMISDFSTRPFLKLIRRWKVLVGGLKANTNDRGFPAAAAVYFAVWARTS